MQLAGEAQKNKLIKNDKEKKSCWKCGKKGDFSGQMCDECFGQAERDYELENEDKWEREQFGETDREAKEE